MANTPYNPLGGTSRTVDPVMDFGWAISRGYVSGHTRFSKNGYNVDVDDTEEDIWTVGGTYVFPAAAQQMEVISSSALDTSDGTGVRTVRIGYLDTNYVSRTEVVTLNGVTAVPTVATNILRINSFRVVTTGTGLKAAGNIDVRNLADTPIYGRIAAGYTRGRNSAYTVPEGYDLFVNQISYASNATSSGHFGRFTFRSNYDEVADTVDGSIMWPFSEIAVQDQTFTIVYGIPMRFPERADIKVSVIGEAPNVNLVVSTQYRGYLVAHHD